MQEGLKSEGACCEYNGMELNALKCKVMDITRAHKIDKNKEYLQPTYEIGGIILGQVETERLLGVHISKDLRWNHHTEVPRKKATQILGVCTAQSEGLHAQSKSSPLFLQM
jgi:hypothetical protein